MWSALLTCLRPRERYTSGQNAGEYPRERYFREQGNTEPATGWALWAVLGQGRGTRQLRAFQQPVTTKHWGFGGGCAKNPDTRVPQDTPEVSKGQQSGHIGPSFRPNPCTMSARCAHSADAPAVPSIQQGSRVSAGSVVAPCARCSAMQEPLQCNLPMSQQRSRRMTGPPFMVKPEKLHPAAVPVHSRRRCL